MADQIYVACHAPNLTALHFETVCGVGTQKGFLIGSIQNQIVTVTTDDNEAKEESKTVIYIEHCVPVTQEHLWNNVNLLINSDILATYRNNIVGWYSFRKNARVGNCSLKDNLIHSSLLKKLKIVREDTFVLALLSASPRYGSSSHTYYQTFLRRLQGRPFEPLRFKISSLSDKLTNSSGYLSGTPFPVSENFKSLSLNVTHGNNVDIVQNLFAKAHERLSELNAEVLHLERMRLELEGKVKSLRNVVRPPVKLPEIPFVSTVLAKREFTNKLISYDPDKNYSKSRNPINLVNLQKECEGTERQSSERDSQSNEQTEKQEGDADSSPEIASPSVSQEELMKGRGSASPQNVARSFSSANEAELAKSGGKGTAMPQSLLTPTEASCRANEEVITRGRGRGRGYIRQSLYTPVDTPSRSANEENTEEGSGENSNLKSVTYSETLSRPANEEKSAQSMNRGSFTHSEYSWLANKEGAVRGRGRGIISQSKLTPTETSSRSPNEGRGGGSVFLPSMSTYSEASESFNGDGKGFYFGSSHTKDSSLSKTIVETENKPPMILKKLYVDIAKNISTDSKNVDNAVNVGKEAIDDEALKKHD